MQLLPPLTRDPEVVAREAPAGRHLPYARHVDDHTIETRDGLLMQVLHLRGLLFETADTEEINYRKRLRDAMLQSIGSSRFAVYSHVVRRRVDAELAAISRRLLAAARRPWRRGSRTRSSTSTTVPDAGPAPAAGPDRTARPAARRHCRGECRGNELRQLDVARDALLAALGSYRPRLLGVYQTPQGTCSEPLEFLSSLLQWRDAPGAAADAGSRRLSSLSPGQLRAGDRRARPTGTTPRSFHRDVSIKDYPGQTAPGMLDELLRLPFELTVAQSFGFVDRQAALSKMNLALRRMRSAEDEAVSLRADLSSAKDDVAAGRAGFGEHHMTIAVRGDTPAKSMKASPRCRRCSPTWGSSRCARRSRSSRRSGRSSRQLQIYRAARPDLDGNFAGSRAATICRRALRGQSLGRRGHAARDDRGRPLLFQLPPGRSRQFHRDRALGIGQDGGAQLPARPGAQVRAADHLLRQGSRRRAVPARDRRALRSAAARHASGLNPLQIDDTPANRQFLIDWIALLAGGADIEETARIKDAIDANFDQPIEQRGCATSPSCSAAATARTPPICGRGCGPGGAKASAPGCSTMRATRPISPPTRSAST
jgi:type IV secretion system protein VirB4